MTNEEAKVFLDNLKICINEHPVVADWLVEIENRNDEPSDSEKPNNCEYAENPSGDVWECGCFLDTYCEHQIYDRNPDGTINIVECGYEPKDKPQTCEECEHWNDTEDGCADRPSGEWIDMGDFEQCSVCKGTRLKEFQTYYGKATWIKTDYCPNCGAKMSKESE